MYASHAANRHAGHVAAAIGEGEASRNPPGSVTAHVLSFVAAIAAARDASNGLIGYPLPRICRGEYVKPATRRLRLKC